MRPTSTPSAPRDRVALGEDDLRRLATAYLDATEQTFVADGS